MPWLHPSDFIQRLQLATYHVQLHVDGNDSRTPFFPAIQQGMAAILEMMDAGLTVVSFIVSLLCGWHVYLSILWVNVRFHRHIFQR